MSTAADGALRAKLIELRERARQGKAAAAYQGRYLAHGFFAEHLGRKDDAARACLGALESARRRGDAHHRLRACTGLARLGRLDAANDERDRWLGARSLELEPAAAPPTHVGREGGLYWRDIYGPGSELAGVE